MLRRAIPILTLCVSPIAVAEVYISNISVNTDSQQVFVKAAEASIHPIGTAEPGETFDIQVVVDNDVYKDISAYVVDEINLNLLKQNQSYNIIGAQKAVSPIHFQAKSNTYSQNYLILDNRHAMVVDKNVRFQVISHSQIPAKQVNETKQLMELLYAELKKHFIFDDFNIRIEPCSQANAFSDPDITLCSELLLELGQKNKLGAVYGIFLHEIGHSLLNLWGLPGFDNEDIADEFAVSIMVRNEEGKKALYEMMEWFSEHNVNAQVQNMVTAGDRHSLSIQRIRNIERVLSNPAPVTARWNKMLYPHYTNEALKKTIEDPDLYDDIELATSILEQREKTKNLDVTN